MMRFLCLCFLFILAFSGLSGQDREAYIRKYRDIAIAEMQRTGIPASIKMAQAMLESNCGTSDLACKTNNHFGIKCGNSWTGKSYHKVDDDYKDGQLVPSCFREFSSTEECFIAHSDFLADPKKSYRYGFLFNLDPADYKAWAHGLKKAGYATEPQYADRLISIIEKYELYLLDDISRGDVVAFSGKKPTVNIRIREVNGVKYIEAGRGESLKSISGKQSMSAMRLYKWNDEAYAISESLEAGTRVFIASKKPVYHGKQKTHKVEKGESLHDIAQKYGVKMESLRKRNKLQRNEDPAPGEKIALAGKPDKPVKAMKQQPPVKYQAPEPAVPKGDPYELPKEVASVRSEPTMPVSEPVITQTQATTNDPKGIATTETPKASIDKAPTPHNTEHVKASISHQVGKGDTLYSIARTHGLSVDELKKMNNLTADTISIGQNLIIK